MKGLEQNIKAFVTKHHWLLKVSAACFIIYISNKNGKQVYYVNVVLFSMWGGTSHFKGFQLYELVNLPN